MCIEESLIGELVFSSDGTFKVPFVSEEICFLTNSEADELCDTRIIFSYEFGSILRFSQCLYPAGKYTESETLAPSL